MTGDDRVDEPNSPQTRTAGAGSGLAIGLAIGVAVGIATDDLGFWMLIGLSTGVVCGSAFDARRSPN